jgi:hypothetical protein
MSQDGYLRLTVRGPRVADTLAAGPGAMLFADVEPGALLAGGLTTLRDVPHDVFRDVRWLLARAQSASERARRLSVALPESIRRRLGPAGHPARGLIGETLGRAIGSGGSRPREPSQMLLDLRTQTERLELRCHVGLLHQPVGREAWLEGDVPHDAQLIERARAVELEALMAWGRAVWTPTDYHYRLPSGEHAAGFVRVANTIRGPRDAEVLASWLYPQLRDGVGFVLDTGTLTAVVESAVAAMRGDGREPGPITVLDHYPTTDLDVSRAVRAARRRNAVLAVLSVNSSGQVLDRLVRAMAAIGAGAETSVTVLINKSPIEQHRSVESGVVVDIWHPLPGHEPVVHAGPSDQEACELCIDQKTSTIVPISPDTFDATLKAAVRTITPSVSDATTNRTLWELCDEYDAIAIESQPPEDLARYRPPGPMALRIGIDQMLSHDDFRRRAVQALTRSLNLQGRRDLPGDLASDLLLVPRREIRLPGMDHLVRDLEPVIGRPENVKGFPIDERWDDDLRRAVTEAKTLGVLSLGTVTGTTLYQALAESQALREPGELLTAFVLHPRMADQRAWQTLENAYAHRLFSAWHSFLRLRSPIAEEARTLDAFTRDERFARLSDVARDFFDLRQRFCTDVQPAAHGLFWGSTPADRLTPNSIYGQGLHGPAAYAAVASAMERSRRQPLPRAEPERRVFELDAMARSYYDPMILSAMMRWLEPHEAWWGWAPEDARTIVFQMLVRLGEEGQQLILASELLLAAAQGKLARPAIGELRAMAEALAARVSPERRGPLDLGLAMAPDYLTLDQQRARTRWEGRLAALDK